MDGIFSALRSNLDGMSTQMKRLQTIAENIANAQCSAREDGKVYKRKIVVENPSAFQETFKDKMNLTLERSNEKHISKSDYFGAGNGLAFSPKSPYKIVKVDKVDLVYDPTNPNADEQGYVRKADINVVEEMVDLMSANRAYEANISVMNAAKEMAKNTLKL